MKKRYLLGIFCLLLSGCSNTDKTYEKYSDNLMDVGFDTVVSFTAYTEDENAYDEYKQKLVEDFKYYNQLFDKYNDYTGVNNIKTINDNAGIQPVKVDQNIIDLMKLSKEFSEKTDNQFDITMGPVLEIWHTYRDAGTAANTNNEESAIPTIDELEQAKTCVGWNNVEINEEDSTVYLNNSCASLDVGSIAKGYATEKTAQDLEMMGVTSAIINAGGNVRIIGNKPDGNVWNVGIEVPNFASFNNESLATISLPGSGSFVTSGDYQRFYYYKDKMMHHIIDPKTLFPADHFRSVVIVDNDSSATADILSTSLFTLPYEDGKTLIESLQSEGHNIEVVWVFDETTSIPENVETTKSGNYTLVYSGGLKDKLTVKK